MSNWDATYDALAGCYDAMTEDVNYPAWADFLEKLFRREKKPVHTVLDLACGTGTMSFLLAERGYEMIGVDFSPEMLAVAAEKALPEGLERPIFLCQPMEKLDLYGTVDACVCLLDSVNHVTKPAKLQKAFQRVRLFLEPGGLFVFDVHTPSHLESLDGGMFLDETEDAYCVWRTDYNPRRRICTYAMDVFQREGEVWLREAEVHEEYAYTPEELTAYLAAAGFTDIRQYGSLKLRKPAAGEERIFFTARKPR
ncbi:MAG: class I SAM-dependent methyltransferase [Clostridiales bacterium]|nr:class I SAM-dependent methyltransferase [Clostridiales bacterium]